MAERPVADLGLYLHLPFCHSRCTYCAFYTVADHAGTRQQYVAALCREVERVAATGRFLEELHLPAQEGRPVETIYLGGGTPSLLSPAQMDEVLSTLHRHFAVRANAEITMEANPETVSAAAAEHWAAAGINRVCLGAQSFRDEVLRRLGRGHGAAEIAAAVSLLRRAGIASISLDLIAGVQTDSFMEDVDQAIALQPEHISLYLLEVDEDEVGGVTTLARQAAQGRFDVPDQDWFADVYPGAVERLDRAGLKRYEISNFARDGHQSRHNLRYWTCAEVLGFGVAAHSLVNGSRHAVTADLEGYLAASTAGEQPVMKVDPVALQERIAEAWILGLRLDCGVSVQEIAMRTGQVSVPYPQAQVLELSAADLLQTRDGRLSLTPRGVMLSNEVFQAFLP